MSYSVNRNGPNWRQKEVAMIVKTSPRHSTRDFRLDCLRSYCLRRIHAGPSYRQRTPLRPLLWQPSWWRVAATAASGSRYAPSCCVRVVSRSLDAVAVAVALPLFYTRCPLTCHQAVDNINGQQSMVINELSSINCHQSMVINQLSSINGHQSIRDWVLLQLIIILGSVILQSENNYSEQGSKLFWCGYSHHQNFDELFLASKLKSFMKCMV